MASRASTIPETAKGIAACWAALPRHVLRLCAHEAAEFGEMDCGVHLDPRLVRLLRTLDYLGFRGADGESLAKIADDCEEQDPDLAEGVRHG